MDKLDLPNMDFDTGRPTAAGEYSLADKTYAHLLDDLAKKHFDQLAPSCGKTSWTFMPAGSPDRCEKKQQERAVRHGKKRKSS